MGSDKQIVIVGTGYSDNYTASELFLHDRPQYIIHRDGSYTFVGRWTSNVIAVENVGPLVNDGGMFYPAQKNNEGRYRRIPNAEPVRVPYEYCTCKPYHGCTLYEYIGDKQMQTIAEMLKSMLQQRGIKYPWDNQLGGISPRAKAGGSGVYFASSYDDRRADIHPQRELLTLIKSLAS